jgi:hypothetical protein
LMPWVGTRRDQSSIPSAGRAVQRVVPTVILGSCSLCGCHARPACCKLRYCKYCSDGFSSSNEHSVLEGI